ncbi:hypothetical protein Anas_13755 [Armadillidium nasatum]|uniref:Uncharacterized protein n=1 Tax=Armadillidium nasatum TaxID=96803 RepID=A0A5N5T4U6_9CRUS|nr:hypothetical protein Anas_13755 [Armadillidium nasatum]
MPGEIKNIARPLLRFKKLSSAAMTPKKGSEKAAGYDLFRIWMKQNVVVVVLAQQAKVSELAER